MKFLSLLGACVAHAALASTTQDGDIVQALMSELAEMRAERIELINVLKEATEQLAVANTASKEHSVDNSNRRPSRRRLASSNDAPGILIKRDDGAIAFGENSDVVLARAGVGDLNIMANVTVLGNLDASSITGVDFSAQQSQLDSLAEDVETKANQTALDALQETVDGIGGDSWDNQERAGLALSLCMGAVGGSASSFLSIITVPYQTDAISTRCATTINSGWKACGVVKDYYHGQNCHGTFGGSLSTEDLDSESDTWGGYMSFIPKASVESGSWNSGYCDHDSTWVCCSPQC